MKALTIWQPWATLIIAGAKPYEFRRWPAPKFVRGKRIVIHAGARPVRGTELRLLIWNLMRQSSAALSLDTEIAMPILERVKREPGCLPLDAAEQHYRMLAKKRHPDAPGGSTEAMAELNAAIAEARKELAG